jgi:hypothetical protein
VRVTVRQLELAVVTGSQGSWTCQCFSLVISDHWQEHTVSEKERERDLSEDSSNVSAAIAVKYRLIRHGLIATCRSRNIMSKMEARSMLYYYSVCWAGSLRYSVARTCGSSPPVLFRSEAAGSVDADVPTGVFSSAHCVPVDDNCGTGSTVRTGSCNSFSSKVNRFEAVFLFFFLRRL